jgi:RimJ/RimL family protein N-acetyltransferase
MQPSLGSAPEAGWVMAPRAHGKGYATEAVRAALAWADAA